MARGKLTARSRAYARRRQLGEEVKFAKNWTDLIEGPLENTGTNVPRSIKAGGFE